MMTLRPEPVTSKFRRYYQKEIIPIYRNSNLSNSSSAGSTSSLTSILHHESCHDLNVLQYDSCDDLPTNYNKFTSTNIPENSIDLANLSTFNNKPKKQNGVIREYLNSSPTGIYRAHKSNQSQKKSCKRIIARKPDYPGFRITHVSYDGQLLDKRISKTPKLSTNTSKSIKKPIENNVNADIKPETQNRIKRKKKVIKTDEKVEKETSFKSVSAVSDHHYTVCEFTSASKSVPVPSGEPIGDTQPTGTKKINETESKRERPPASSVDEVDSFISEDAPESTFSSRSDLGTDETSNVDMKTAKSSNRLLTAWEGWFLKKEEQDRKLMEKERQKMQIEEAQKKEQEKLKQERREVCEKKIMEWLKKKEEERVKTTAEKQSQEKKAKELLECKKDDTLKKASAEFVAWKLKKLELKKQRDRHDKETAATVEREKAAKHDKAKRAFSAWLEQHRDHQLPVPYSYGISDGKLTSYYDKTSNPPPAFFNPKLWVSVLETK